MSGRGRGRGRGKYTPPTGAQLFLKRSAEECGLDSRNLRTLQDITRPRLFPDIILHSSGDQKRLLVEEEKKRQELERAAAGGGGDVKSEPSPSSSSSASVVGVKRSAATIYLISKGREIHHRMQNGAFYVKPTKDVPDVWRYSDSVGKKARESTRAGFAAGGADASLVLSHCLGGRSSTQMGRFVPEELATGQRLGGRGDSSAAAGKALSLEEIVARERKKKAMAAAAGEGEDEEEEGGEAVEDEEEEEGEDYVMNYYESADEEYGEDDEEEAAF